jgi:D-3-phosphoglycerate dehydrogenase
VAKFRVAFSGDFFRPDGQSAYPDVDVSPLTGDPRIEVGIAHPVDRVLGADALAGYDALILFAPRVARASLPSDGRLGLVARFGVGFDNVDVAGLAAEGVATCIAPQGVRRPVAVAILTLALALTAKLMVKHQLTREGAAGFAKRADHMGVGLEGRTLGSIGIGNIGAEMFRLFRPLGMSFIAHDPWADPALARELGVRLVGLDDVFRQADIVAVNCPLNDTTRRLVNADRLGLMKPSAYLINTARGPIVDQQALTEVLRAGRIAGAGLDVFDPEPPDPADPLLALPNVILAPHALASTDQCFAMTGAADIAAVLAVMQGREPEAIVDRRVLDHPRWRERLARNRATFGR